MVSPLEKAITLIYAVILENRWGLSSKTAYCFHSPDQVPFAIIFSSQLTTTLHLLYPPRQKSTSAKRPNRRHEVAT